MKYYTLCRFDVTEGNMGRWFDIGGFTTKAEAKAELAWDKDDTGKPGTHYTILENDGSATKMIAQRDALPAPRGFRLEA